MLRLGPHRKVAAPTVVVGAIPAVAGAFDFGGSAGVRVLVMAAVALLVFWVFAVAFDHRRPDSSLGEASLRLVPIALFIIAGLLVFADPWVFSFGVTAATPAFAVLMVIELALAFWVWFQSRSGSDPPSTLTPSVDASTQRSLAHVASGVVFAAIVVFGGVFFGALASYCSGDARSFYAIVIVASLAGMFVVACGAWMDRRFSTGGVALAMGRTILVGIAATILVFVVLAAIPLPPANCN